MSIQFEYIDGRRYQTSMPYFAPVDEAEIVRQDLEDTMLRLWWGNSFGSPVAERLNGEGTKVLDVGCGAGSWMCDLAIRYPKTLFVGLDISPMFPRDNPTNAAFLEWNILEKMPFPDSTFDFVHQRMLSGGITQKQWENYIVMELVRITKPNGYVEFVEADSTFYSSGKVTRRISNACKYNSLKRHTESKGQCGFIGTHIKGILENTQQVTNITHDVKDIVLGNRAGKSGEMALQNIVEMLKSIRPALSKSMEITNNHFDALVETFMRETNVYETIWRVHRVYACKIDAPV
ncbi:9720_t:CDS:2 [Paraglomus brasilianum]|uniref:9720_t:CDS:1 n=1 Tax=Paraglomus brasilianum TaxID=144538 RepID=A0A9N8WNM3_9GLOM|nr:9720_t:CDS:2 [Paraglomus brasilianum]